MATYGDIVQTTAKIYLYENDNVRSEQQRGILEKNEFAQILAVSTYGPHAAIKHKTVMYFVTTRDKKCGWIVSDYTACLLSAYDTSRWKTCQASNIYPGTLVRMAPGCNDIRVRVLRDQQNFTSDIQYLYVQNQMLFVLSVMNKNSFLEWAYVYSSAENALGWIPTNVLQNCLK